VHYIHADAEKELVAMYDEANRLCRLIGEIMHDETEAAEAIPNPMMGRRRHQFFVPDQYLDVRAISGTSCTKFKSNINQSILFLKFSLFSALGAIGGEPIA
jgi:hypothetical protein